MESSLYAISVQTSVKPSRHNRTAMLLPGNDARWIKRATLDRFFCFSLSLLFSIAYDTTNSSAVPAPPVPTEHTIARKLPVEGVPNLGEVSPTLYRGAQPTQQGFRKLAEMGITIVVDLRVRRLKVERQQVTKLGLRFVTIPWNCFHPKDTDIAQFLKLLRDNRGKKVFVHCQTGLDRTGMMIAAYRIAEQGWTAEEAMNEMKAYGFNSWHHLICPGLSSYEEKFPERFKASPAFLDLRRHESAQPSR